MNDNPLKNPHPAQRIPEYSCIYGSTGLYKSQFVCWDGQAAKRKAPVYADAKTGAFDELPLWMQGRCAAF
jgi:hypothetical protein